MKDLFKKLEKTDLGKGFHLIFTLLFNRTFLYFLGVVIWFVFAESYLEINTWVYLFVGGLFLIAFIGRLFWSN